jgi:hypothetical protein
MSLYPPTAEEIAARNAEIELYREDQRRKRIALLNRKAGRPQPKPGDTLYVSTQRGIPRRARAGIIFSSTEPTPVKVFAETDEEILTRQKGGETAVNPTGAEDILADTGPIGGLMVHLNAGAARDAIEKTAKLESENAALKSQLSEHDALLAENAKLRRQLEARGNAGGTGGPERLAPGKDEKPAKDDKPANGKDEKKS